MFVRNFIPGDQDKIAQIANHPRNQIPGLASIHSAQVKRWSAQHDFDPKSCFLAEVDGQAVGFTSYDPKTQYVNPAYCLPGHEKVANHLFVQMIRSATERGIPRVYTTVKPDCTELVEFFEDQGFDLDFEMANYTQSITELPTMFQRPGLNIQRFATSDVPEIEQLGGAVLRKQGAELGQYLQQLSQDTDTVFVLRRRDGRIKGVGVLFDDAALTPLDRLDVSAPTFRYGSFGTEGFPGIKVNGMFSFIAPNDREVESIGQDLLWYATSRSQDNSFTQMCAQVSTQAQHLTFFYDRFFVKQSTFKVYAREITNYSRF